MKEENIGLVALIIAIILLLAVNIIAYKTGEITHKKAIAEGNEELEKYAFSGFATTFVLTSFIIVTVGS